MEDQYAGLSSVVALSPDPEWEATQLVLRPDLTFEQWASIGSSLDVMERGVNWWIGDWLNYGERTYGEKYTQAVLETGRRYQTLINMAYVARQVEYTRRRPSVSWSAHAEVAALSPTEQDDILARAEAEEWTRGDVRAAVRALTTGVQVAPGTTISADAAPTLPPSPNGSHAANMDAVGASTPAETDGGGDDDVDPVAEWERAEAEVRRLTALVDQLASESASAQAAAAAEERFRALEGRLRQAMAEKQEVVALATKREKTLRSIRALLQVDTDKEITAAIKRLLA